jgi:hypothetical protein
VQSLQIRPRLDAAPVDQRFPDIAIGGQRLGPALGAIKRPHLQAAQRLPLRVQRHQSGQLLDNQIVAAEVQVGVGANLERPQPSLAQPSGRATIDGEGSTSASGSPRHIFNPPTAHARAVFPLTRRIYRT